MSPCATMVPPMADGKSKVGTKYSTAEPASQTRARRRRLAFYGSQVSPWSPRSP